jgi:hypothetical protein
MTGKQASRERNGSIIFSDGVPRFRFEIGRAATSTGRRCHFLDDVRKSTKQQHPNIAAIASNKSKLVDR